MLTDVNPQLFNNRVAGDYKKIMVLMSPQNVDSKNIIEKLKKIDSIKKPFCTYHIGTIVFLRTNQFGYWKLLDQFFSTPEAELEKSIAPKFLIDKGTWYYFTVLKDGKTKNYTLNSPRAELQPILFKLVEETIKRLPKKIQDRFNY